MYVPEFLYKELDSNLPLDATYVLNNSNLLKELNVHTIYPALFVRLTTDAINK